MWRHRKGRTRLEDQRSAGALARRGADGPAGLDLGARFDPIAPDQYLRAALHGPECPEFRAKSARAREFLGSMLGAEFGPGFRLVRARARPGALAELAARA